MSRLTRDGTAEPVSRDQILGRERGKEIFISLVQLTTSRIWQPYPIDPYSAICDGHTYMHTLWRERTVEPVSRDQVLRRLQGQGKKLFILRPRANIMDNFPRFDVCFSMSDGKVPIYSALGCKLCLGFRGYR